MVLWISRTHDYSAGSVPLSYSTSSFYGKENRTVGAKERQRSSEHQEIRKYEPVDLIPFFHYPNGQGTFPTGEGMGTVEIIPPHRSFRDKLGRTVFLRPYEEGDFKGLSSMYDEFEPKGRAMGLPPVQEKSRHKWMAGIVEEWFNIVAVLENRIVGHAALDLPVGTTAREFMIFVHQDYQNKGIGQALTFSMLDAAREMNTRKVWVVVDNMNRIAITVFKKAGFSFASEPDTERLMVANP